MLWLAGSATPLPGILGYRLINAGDGEVGRSWSTGRSPPYRAGHHSIQSVLAGDGAIEVDGAWHALRPGMTVVVPGHRWLRRRGGPGLRLRFAGFAVEPARADLALGACPGPVAAGPDDAALIAGGLSAALAVLHGAAGADAAARTVAALAVAGALLARDATGAPPPAIPAAVVRARDFLDRAYCASPSLAAVAAAAGRSPNHLHQAFRAALGCTPAAYAERLRLRDAQLLLADPALPVAEVARRCGYADPYHFSRVVRRACGASPLALRRRLQPVQAGTETG